MTQARPAIIVSDTSVLVNFLCIDRMDLIARYSHPIVVTDHVGDEITNYYPDQQARLTAALTDGTIRQLALVDPAELALFGMLAASGRLGTGECSAIALAIHHGHLLAIDDRRAANEARRSHAALRIVTTQDLVTGMIREKLIAVTDADLIKDDWATNHRFRLPIASFADVL